MKFLSGAPLNRKIASLVSGKGPLKAAVAHWGASALETVMVDPERSDVQILCRLRDGASAPSVIRTLRGMVRQDDRLNAKVVWTPGAAVIGSMDVASNGALAEEHLAHEFVEAGFLVEDPEALAEISLWFDDLWVRSRPVSDGELRKAEEARRIGPFPELVELQPADLSSLRVAVMTYVGQRPSLGMDAVLRTDVADLAGRTVVAFRRGDDGRFHDPELALAVASGQGKVAMVPIPANLPRFSLGRLSLSRLRSRLAKADPLVSGPTVHGEGLDGAWVAVDELLGR